MAIVNGTFDTDLSGWTPTVSGDADLVWDAGRTRMRIYQCNYAEIKQDFVIDKPILSFDWEQYFEWCPERPGAQVVIEGQTVYYQDAYGYWAPYCIYGRRESGTENIDLSTYIGKTATVTFFIHGYPGYCSYGDHRNTYFWIDNVKLTGVAPNIGSAAFSSEPSGAGIILDGTDTGHVTPYTISNLNPGTHSYTLRLANYQYYSGTIDVISGQTVTVIATLQPLYGNLYVTSVPTGVKIFIDEIDTGQVTSVTISNLTAGSHTYRLSQYAYFDSIGTIDIIANTTVTLSVTMTAMATTCQVFNSVPKDAKIIINGWDLGYKTPINLCGVPVGYNYFELEGTFTIAEKGKSVQPFISVPKGARVIVDGLDMGDTPMVLKDIPVGIHTYRLMGTFTA